MPSQIIVPEDLKQLIAEILANEEKEKEEAIEEDDRERVYIEDIIPDIKDDEQKDETWKIEISL